MHCTVKVIGRSRRKGPVLYSVKTSGNGVEIVNVQKRFSDFENLHQQLVSITERPLPLLPDKHLFGIGIWRDAAETLERRAAGLETYMNALILETNLLDATAGEVVELADFLQLDFLQLASNFLRLAESPPSIPRRRSNTDTDADSVAPDDVPLDQALDEETVPFSTRPRAAPTVSTAPRAAPTVSTAPRARRSQTSAAVGALASASATLGEPTRSLTKPICTLLGLVRFALGFTIALAWMLFSLSVQVVTRVSCHVTSSVGSLATSKIGARWPVAARLVASLRSLCLHALRVHGLLQLRTEEQGTRAESAAAVMAVRTAVVDLIFPMAMWSHRATCRVLGIAAADRLAGVVAVTLAAGSLSFFPAFVVDVVSDLTARTTGDVVSDLTATTTGGPTDAESLVLVGTMHKPMAEGGAHASTGSLSTCTDRSSASTAPSSPHSDDSDY